MSSGNLSFQHSATAVPSFVSSGASGQSAQTQQDVGGRPLVKTYRKTEKEIGRNDPCPCGSGKKYKNCHGKQQKVLQ